MAHAGHADEGHHDESGGRRFLRGTLYTFGGLLGFYILAEILWRIFITIIHM